jgi:hypothetical protein
MIEINGVKTPNAFADIPFCKIPKGRYVNFVRIDCQPLTIYSDWADSKQGGATGVKIERHTSSWAVPLFVQTMSTFYEGASDISLKEVRWYESMATQQDPVSRQSLTVYEGLVLFNGPNLKLDMNKQSDKELFRFLMVHPMNELHSNRLGVKPVFRLVEPEKIAAEKNRKKQLANTAIALIYNEDKVPNSVAAKIHKNLFAAEGWNNTGELILIEDYETIKMNLSDYAANNPEELIKMVNDHNIGLRAEINEGVTAGIIVFDSNEWLWGKTKAVKNNKSFLTVPAGEDEITELITFFVTNKKLGARALEDLRNELKGAVAQA